MKLTITYINPRPGSRTILLSKGASTLPNGMRSIGGVAGFVSVPTPEAKLQFQVGQEIEVSDNATIEKKKMKQLDGSVKEIDAWINL